MTVEKAGRLIMATVKRKALTEISLGIILYLAIFTFSVREKREISGPETA
jgi:hypothetical protein